MVQMRAARLYKALTLYKITKLSSFCSTKDPIPFNIKSHVTYQLQHPRRGETSGHLRSVKRTSQKPFWSTVESVANILFPEKRRNCGIGTIQIGFQPKI